MSGHAFHHIDLLRLGLPRRKGGSGSQCRYKVREHGLINKVEM